MVGAASVASERALPSMGRAVARLGWALGLFLALTYVLCVGFDLLWPQYAMYPVWSRLLPGFVWLDWGSFFLGLAESFLYGWYIAVVYVPLERLARRLAGVR